MSIQQKKIASKTSTKLANFEKNINRAVKKYFTYVGELTNHLYFENKILAKQFSIALKITLSPTYTHNVSPSNVFLLNKTYFRESIVKLN